MHIKEEVREDLYMQAGLQVIHASRKGAWLASDAVITLAR
jgi:hypothetical protein